MGLSPIFWAGLPATIWWSGTSLDTTDIAPAMTWFPIVTPGRIIARVPINEFFPIVIGLVMSWRLGSLKSWVPVHRYASWETVAVSMISIFPSECATDLSPRHARWCIVRCQGIWIQAFEWTKGEPDIVVPKTFNIINLQGFMNLGVHEQRKNQVNFHKTKIKWTHNGHGFW